MITELRSVDQQTRSQETVVGKMILVSARDEVKRTEHCMKMPEGRLSRVLARWIQRMDDSSQCEDSKQQEMEKNAVYEVRATRSAYTSNPSSNQWSNSGDSELS